jgi:hypothetical protein
MAVRVMMMSVLMSMGVIVPMGLIVPTHRAHRFNVGDGGAR